MMVDLENRSTQLMGPRLPALDFPSMASAELLLKEYA
jgi:hypothetical protein